MDTKARGSEKVMFICEKNGKRSLSDFENVEEALQASGGMIYQGVNINPYAFKPWWILGKPGPDVLGTLGKLRNFENVAQQ